MLAGFILFDQLDLITCSKEKLYSLIWYIFLEKGKSNKKKTDTKIYILVSGVMWLKEDKLGLLLFLERKYV